MAFHKELYEQCHFEMESPFLFHFYLSHDFMYKLGLYWLSSTFNCSPPTPQTADEITTGQIRDTCKLTTDQ